MQNRRSREGGDHVAGKTAISKILPSMWLCSQVRACTIRAKCGRATAAVMETDDGSDGRISLTDILTLMVIV
jgi:hypothetical protein